MLTFNVISGVTAGNRRVAVRARPQGQCPDWPTSRQMPMTRGNKSVFADVESTFHVRPHCAGDLPFSRCRKSTTAWHFRLQPVAGVDFCELRTRKQPSVDPCSGANVCQNDPSMRISQSPLVLFCDLFRTKVEFSAARVFIDSDTRPEPAPKSARVFAFQPSIEHELPGI